MTVRSTVLALILALTASSASGLDTANPSEWLDRLDRPHRDLILQQGHVHAEGHVQAVDSGPGTVTLIAEEMRSPDNTVWMPAMRMVFHVTNRQLLQGIQPEDLVEFEAVKLRGANGGGRHSSGLNRRSVFSSRRSLKGRAAQSPGSSRVDWATYVCCRARKASANSGW